MLNAELTISRRTSQAVQSHRGGRQLPFDGGDARVPAAQKDRPLYEQRKRNRPRQMAALADRGTQLSKLSANLSGCGAAASITRSH
jgi:hypothetical protein